MITQSHFLLSIAMELCWRPPSIHPTPTGTIEWEPSTGSPSRNLLRAAFAAEGGGSLCVLKEAETFALLNPFTLL